MLLLLVEYEAMISMNNNKISDLIGSTCYLFGVCGCTVNGYRLWTIIGSQTIVELRTTQPTLCTNEGSNNKNYK